MYMYMKLVRGDHQTELCLKLNYGERIVSLCDGKYVQ